MNDKPQDTETLEQKKKEDMYEQSIKNLEILYNQSYMLNRLYKVKDYMLNSPTLRKKINNLEKWRVVRNLCMVILISGTTRLYIDVYEQRLLPMLNQTHI